MENSNILFLIVAAALAAALATAALSQPAGTQSFSASLRAINDSITNDGQAAFELTISNPNSYIETYRISVQDIDWSIQSDPLYAYFSGMDVPAYGTGKATIYLKPTTAFAAGVRNIRVAISAVKGKQAQTLTASVNIRSNNRLLLEYLAAVSRIAEIPAQIDPRNEFEIKINLINRNPKNISDLKVRLQSVSTSIINEEIATTLGPLESKTVTAKIKLDPLTKPAKDALKVVLLVDNNPLEPTIFEKFEIISYSEIKQLRSEKKGALFKWVNETTYVNDGNVRGKAVIETESSLLKTLFTRSEPKSFTISKEGKRFNAWELALEPQETITIRTTESYRSILYLLLIAVAFSLIYRFLQSPVKLIKEASAISYKEGGVSELKVILRVKNRSAQPYIKLTLMDRVPMIAEVEHDSMGTLKPATVFNDGRGSVVKWELENVDRHEERILAYKIRSKLSILGTFTLPKASVRFYTEKNVKFATHSNTVTIKP